MFKRPIVGIAIYMAVGIFVGYAAGVPLKFAYGGFFTFSIGSVLAWILEKRVERGVTFIFICLATFFLGITLMQEERQNLLSQARALGLKFPGNKDKIETKKENTDFGWHSSEMARRFQYLTIHGIIINYPEERVIYYQESKEDEEEENEAKPAAGEGKKISFPLKIEEVRRKDTWEEMDGKVLVNIYEPDEIASGFALAMTRGRAHNGNEFGNDTEKKFRIGDRLEINGQLRPLPGPRNPGDFDYGVYLLRKGIVGQMSIKQKGKGSVVSGRHEVIILSRNNINFITRIAARGRDWMEKIIDLGPYDNGRDVLLKAMLIGKREGLDEGMKENFINTGTVHIMAISGLHLIIVMAIILFICKISFLPERFSSILCIAFLVIYAFLTGGRASIWRATIMAGIFLGGKFFFRQVDKWTSLSLAGLIIVSISPQALFDSGFQLTFMAVAGLMYLYPRLEDLLRRKVSVLFTKSLSRYLVKAFLVVLVAQLALGPFLIYYYYRFPLVVFVANLAVVPLLGIITTLGFVSSLVGFFSLPLARAFNAVNNIFLLVMERTAAFLGGLQGQIIYLPRMDPIFFLFYYIILFLIFYPLKASHN